MIIRGTRYWLWRAVDNEGEVLDFLVQRRRDAKAAAKLMKKLLKRQGFAPTRIVTDKLRSYRSAFRDIGLTAIHDQVLSDQRERVSKVRYNTAFRPPIGATRPGRRSGSA